MTQKLRIKQLQFIEDDIKNKGEQRVSSIIFFGAIYQTKVKKDGKTKKVNYSGADSCLKGYREILI